MNLLTAKEVQARLRCGPNAVYRLFKNRLLRGVKVPHVGLRIFEDSLAELLGASENKVEPQLLKPSPQPARAKRKAASRVFLDGIV